MTTTNDSALGTRTELIEAFRANTRMLTAAFPPPKPAKAVDPTNPDPTNTDETKPDVDPGDAAVDAKITALETALQALQKAQGADAAGDPDPTNAADAAVSAAIAQITKDLAALKSAQVADEAGESTDPKDPVEPAVTPTKDQSQVTDPSKLAVINSNPAVDQVDAEGNIDPAALCATQGCAHLGAIHQNGDEGENTGPCGTPGCLCEQMTLATNQGSQPAPDDGSGDPGDVEDQSDSASMVSRGDLAAIADVPGLSDDSTPAVTPNLNAPPMIEGSQNMGPAFYMVAIIEGQPTGDGRSLSPNALTWQVPAPLMGQLTSAHDPNGMDPNAPAILCGRIDSFERTPGQGDTQLIIGKGFFLPNEQSMEIADAVGAFGRIGVSADVNAIARAVSVLDVDDGGFPMNTEEVITEGELAGTTVLPFPAFGQCYICLGDGPNAVPAPTIKTDEQLPLAAGGQFVHWMEVEACVPCGDAMDIIAAAESIVASGEELLPFPVRPPKAWFDNPNFTVGDNRLVEIYSGRGNKKFGGQYACPQTITEDGHIFGHLAPWDVCHTGMKGKCVTAPHSKMGYSQFLRQGQQITTAEGDKVTVGVLTFDTGHAPLDPRFSSVDAQGHYDHTGFATADVVVGEDEHGIWYSGAMRPITASQLRAFNAASPSGDWREFGGNLELVAVLQVNQPGFPVAMVAGGSEKAMVAAGAWTMFKVQHPELDVLDHDEIERIGRLAAKPMLRLAKKDASERIVALANGAARHARERLARL